MQDKRTHSTIIANSSYSHNCRFAVSSAKLKRLKKKVAQKWEFLLRKSHSKNVRRPWINRRFIHRLTN